MGQSFNPILLTELEWRRLTPKHTPDTTGFVVRDTPPVTNPPLDESSRSPWLSSEDPLGDRPSLLSSEEMAAWDAILSSLDWESEEDSAHPMDPEEGWEVEILSLNAPVANPYSPSTPVDSFLPSAERQSGTDPSPPSTPIDLSMPLAETRSVDPQKAIALDLEVNPFQFEPEVPKPIAPVAVRRPQPSPPLPLHSSTPSEVSAVATPIPSPPQSPESRSHPESDDLSNTFQKLQEILMGPELGEVRLLVDQLESQVIRLEHQLYNPHELVQLLLPTVIELLNLKISESKQELARTVAPIADQVIQNRAEQDRLAMISAISPLISDSISERIRQSPEEISRAIAPTMGKAIKEQIKLEKDSMVDALYPIIGSTVAKYISEFVHTINQKLENALSREGLWRKVRARVQGISEAELLVQESMPLSVQAVFLIHKNSGLVISEAQQRSEHPLESDMLAGMLTAIRSFANDCIAAASDTSELNTIDYGDSKIILEVAGYCYLATVAKGEPSPELLASIRRTLGIVVRQYGDEIERYDGNPETIPVSISHRLEELSEFEDENTKGDRRPFPLILAAILASVGLAIGAWGVQHQRELQIQQIEQETNQAIALHPQLSMYRLTATVEQGEVILSGRVPDLRLRQQAEQIAQYTAASLSIENHINVVPSVPDLAVTLDQIRRLTDLLNQIEHTHLETEFQSGVVRISGQVNPGLNADEITRSFQQVPGVTRVQATIQPYYPQPTLLPQQNVSPLPTPTAAPSP